MSYYKNDFGYIREFINSHRKLLYFQNENLKMIEEAIVNTSIADESNTDVVVRVGDFAEMIKSRGVPYGRNKIHSWLNNRGYTYRVDNRNYAKEEYINKGLFKVRNYVVNKKSGATVESTIYLTSKGVAYFMEEILREFDFIDIEEVACEEVIREV